MDLPRAALGLAVAAILVCAAGRALAAEVADDQPIPWPVSEDFRAEVETKFRLPFFRGYKTYPDLEPLFNVVWLPKDYDPERAYPLYVEFQPQGAKPGTWQLRQMSENAIGLGMSYVQTTDASMRNMSVIQVPIQAATVQWALRMFRVDRTRVLCGGFSGGGWAASESALQPQFRALSTHFVIMGAGLRGQLANPYDLSLFVGDPVFLAAGTKDMNHDWMRRALDALTAAKLDVTSIEEPDVGHEVGPKTRERQAAWFATFDPSVHAAEWLADAKKQLDDKAVADKTPALKQLAAVATLGPKSDPGKEAQSLLEAREGAALAAYDHAWDELRARRYPEAEKAFAAALAAAQKAKSARLVPLCQKGLQSVADWRCLEEAMTARAALADGRPVEASLLQQEGAGRYKSDPQYRAWTWMWDSIGAKGDAQAKDAKHGAAQVELAKYSVLLWTGGLKAGSLKKARESLQAIVTTLADSSEAREAQALLDRLPAEDAPKK
jgi:predicted esterase